MSRESPTIAEIEEYAQSEFVSPRAADYLRFSWRTSTIKPWTLSLPHFGKPPQVSRAKPLLALSCSRCMARCLAAQYVERSYIEFGGNP